MEGVVRAPAVGERPARRVLLIGWDAADWNFIEPLIARGLMPTLGRLREGGAWGNIATLQPALSPMLWTSIATGKRPTKHGVLGFTEPSPDGAGIRPVASTSRKVKALWNILTQAGLRSNVVGWYATAPAEPIAGVMVANGFENPVAPLDQPWPISANSIHPASLAEELAEWRMHPAELDAAALLPFIPRAAEIDPQTNTPVTTLARLLAQTISIHSIATHLIEQTEWDFTAIYYEGIDRFGHHFMQMHPPGSADVSAREVELYGEVMTGCYRFHDMMLERLLELAGPETTVLLVSDHGYHHGPRRPTSDADPLDWHRDYGIALAAGPGITAGERIYGGSVLDVTPTLLSLLGLSPAADMDGRVWQEILAAPTPAPVASWEDIPGDDGRHSAEQRIDPAEAAAAIRQLVDLGYVEAPSPDQETASRQAALQNQRHLATAYLHASDPRPAVAILRELTAAQPGHKSLQMQLAIALAIAGEKQEAGTLARALLEEPAYTARAALLLARLALSQNALREAAEWLDRVKQIAPDDPDLRLRTGQLYLHAKRYDEAREILTRCLAEDDAQPDAHASLAAIHLARQQPAQALQSALRAAELRHFFPQAHFYIGQALARLDQPEPATAALRLAIKQAPAHLNARTLLAGLLRNLGQNEEAFEHETFATLLRSHSAAAQS